MDENGSNGMRRFTDQVAMVVGGAQGIGKAIAMRLGREGAHVAIADVDCPMMEATVREMRATGAMPGHCRAMYGTLPRCRLQCSGPSTGIAASTSLCMWRESLRGAVSRNLRANMG
jgi:NAD(P)-dependent dehydrogenase (short-subunit alcohol dehydrogenase family)